MKAPQSVQSNQRMTGLWVIASVALAILLFTLLSFGLGGTMNVHAEPTIPGIDTADPPRMEVNYAHDWVNVETTPSASVAVTVAGKAAIAGTADENGWFDSSDAWDPDHPDIQPGDVITASADGLTATVNPVGEIDIAADFDADIVSGVIHAAWFSPTLLTVFCAVWEEGGPGDLEITGVDPDGGSYSCDFSAEGWDLQDDQMIAVSYEEPDGDTVINILNSPWVRVNYGHDWVGADYELGHTFQITVTDSADAIKATAQKDTSAGGGWGVDGFQTDWEDWQPDGPDISPGDWVYFKADDGYANIIRVGEISGTVDLDADSISGPIYADWFTKTLDVECHPWGGWPGPAQVKSSTAEPDGSTPYSCQWDPGEWDVQPGQEIAVLYAMPGARDVVMTVFFGTATRYVATTGSDGGPNMCLDPVAPCKTIGHAISQATQGDEIWIAGGTYVENLTVDKLVDLMGGYESTGWTRDLNRNETIIDGNRNGVVIEFQGGEADGSTLDGLTITGGDSAAAGGINTQGVDITIRNCLIRDNMADGSPNSWGGGGVTAGGNLIIIDTRVISNSAVEGASGVRVGDGHLVMTNTLVADNKTAEGLHLNGSAQLTNVTIANNATNSGRPGINFNPQTGGSLNLVNTIVYSNGDAIHVPDINMVQATYSDIENGWSGTGNIDADPLFVDSANDEYHLQSSSPCIDSGTNANAPDHDLDGTARPQDGDNDGSAVTDMGAYEFEIARIHLPVVTNSTAGK